MDTISPSLYYRFYRYRSGCKIASDGVFSLPEQTAFGTEVLVKEGYRLDIPFPARDGSPRIVIGDRCECNRNLTITALHKVELKADVMTGPHVFITDAKQPWEKGVNGVSSVTIGESSWIGAYSSILGNVKIGKGCVIGAGSVILQDVPDYCVVAGNPAVFRRIYEPSSGEWIRVKSEAQARELLERRRKEPLLSICIPVYNQADELRRCLESIYAQTDDAGLIEVCVLDDASADETEEVASHYGSLYHSFRYLRNQASTVGSLPLPQAVDMARGKFVMAHDSAACFSPGSLIPFLNVLHTHSDCAFVLIEQMLVRGAPQTEMLEGLSEYHQLTAERSTEPLLHILNRQEWNRAADLPQTEESLNSWINRQYALLMSNPRFYLCRYKMFDVPVIH
ncbi:glycosyltransferase [Paenibacillus sp. LMG 31459]|uniref:Glycosyltransferase n=1 Tax=Paenibacillus phytohabitans TaxID=2654978 RepID=A0ABX1YKH5_9BACL|nr:glycosyltransferase [Paenibacillus phytohabitans]NOU81557.1 glycosyltransferase [Paenibacillus phytohabitans]